jgi:hypothetical protein
MTIDLEAIIGGSVFIPSNRQIRARNQFYQRNPGELPPDLSGPLCVQMGAPGAILRWWATPGFSDWWTSPEWEKEESHRIMLQGMAEISRILQDTDAPPQIKLGAAKEAREIYSKLNVQKQEKFADEQINEMTKEQLADYIRRNTQLISTDKKSS